MRISVITATYNSARTVGDALDSLQGQTHPDVESVVVDGASRDGTAELIRARENVGVFVSEPDNGIYDALNKGIRLASGDVVGVLHSDDLLADERVLADVASTFENTGADCVWGDLVFIDRNAPHRVKRYWKSSAHRPGAFRRGWMVPHPTLFVRRQLFDELGMYRTDMRIAADYEFMIRLLHMAGKKGAHIPRVLVKMRLGGESTANIANRYQANREDMAAWKVNALTPPPLLRFLKPLRKLPQFLLSPPKC